MSYLKRPNAIVGVPILIVVIISVLLLWHATNKPDKPTQKAAQAAEAQETAEPELPYTIEELEPGKIIVVKYKVGFYHDYDYTDELLLGMKVVAESYEIRDADPITKMERTANNSAGSYTSALILFVEPKEPE